MGILASDELRRRQLGAFFRAHRALLQPADVGLPHTGRRRTPGLRREEVASLTGLGVAWYTWLEQGRVPVSRQVLDAVSRALRLDDDGYRHALTLAGFQPPSAAAEAQVVAEVQPVLDSCGGPAVLLDRHLDLLAWNTAYVALWTDPAQVEPMRRNLIWLTVGDPTHRQSFTEWESLATALLRQFRAQADKHPSDERFAVIRDLIDNAEPTLGPWLRCHSVREFGSCEVTVRRAVTGPIRLVFSSLRPTADPDCLVLIQSPARASDHERLARLSTVSRAG